MSPIKSRTNPSKVSLKSHLNDLCRLHPNCSIATSVSQMTPVQPKQHLSIKYYGKLGFFCKVMYSVHATAKPADCHAPTAMGRLAMSAERVANQILHCKRNLTPFSQRRRPVVLVSFRSPHLQIFIHLLVDSIYRIARFAPSALNMGQRSDTRIVEQHLGRQSSNLKGGIRLRYKA